MDWKSVFMNGISLYIISLLLLFLLFSSQICALRPTQGECQLGHAALAYIQ